MTTNAEAIASWNSSSRAALEDTAVDGDFAKRHLANPHLLRLAGPLAGRRVLDAGCGNGYLSRMLAERGSIVTGVEPAQVLFDFAVEKDRHGSTFIQADLCAPPDLGAPFDVVICSMVLVSIPDWRAAMRTCADVLRPGGTLVVALPHPCFADLWRTWRTNGFYRTSEYLAERTMPGPVATDFHRPLSAYLNEMARLGCTLTEMVEPGLDPALVPTGPAGIDAYAHLPNFVIMAARKAG